jgi:hypothetical protein
MIRIYNIIFVLLYIINIPSYINAELQVDLEFKTDSYVAFKDGFNFEGELNLNKPYLFVSLGCNCWPALAMRAHELRGTAFPFDWLLTPDNIGLVTCLNEKFNNFWNKSYLIRCVNSFTRIPTDIENNYYNFRFTHDWPFNHQVNNERYKEQLESMEIKYTRRIARFESLKNFTGKVFFLRSFQVDPNYQGEYGWNKEKAQNLQNSLRRFFPELDFILVILSYTDPDISEIGDLNGIKEYKIRNSTSHNFFQTVEKEYKQMFTELVAEFG